MKSTQEKPDKILYYEGRVNIEPVHSMDGFLKLGRDYGFRDGPFGSVCQFIIHSANKETIVEQLDAFIKVLKSYRAVIRSYQYGAVFVDSNNWDTLGVLGNDPHADKR